MLAYFGTDFEMCFTLMSSQENNQSKVVVYKYEIKTNAYSAVKGYTRVCSK